MPKPNPTVSVIIPNYNHAQYIRDAINSVLDQRFRDFEIIVVDDGSTDNSREVVATFGDKVTYIYKQNAGLSAARNTGLEHAKGEFIGVLDADDIYEPEFMSALVPILQADPAAQAVYCGYRFVDVTNQPLPQKEARSIPPHELFQAIAEGNFLVPESILVRKSCYDKVGGFDPALRACEDVDMWLRITSQYKVLGTTQLLTRHRILPNSMSTDPTRQTQNRLAAIGKHFGPQPESDSQWTEPQRRAYGQAYLASTVEYLQARMTERAFESFQRMAQVCPSLLTSLNTFYEMGCGEQPKGHRGDFATLNMERNTTALIEFLERLFQTASLREYQHAAYAQAYFALGLLNYGTNDVSAARACLLKALRYKPTFLLNRRFASTLLRSLLSPKLMSSLRSLRGRSSG